VVARLVAPLRRCPRGDSAPFYPSSFFGQLTQKASPIPAATLARPNEGITARTPVSDCRLLPSRRPPSDQHRDLGPGTASREKPNNLAPFPTGVRRRSLNFEGGGRHSRNFKRRGSRAGRPERRSPTALAGRWFPSDWEGNHSRNFRRCCPGEQYPISYYNELFVWNQACQRQPAHFHLIGAETQIGRRTPSIVQSNR
jgi:hypothetical protein